MCVSHRQPGHFHKVLTLQHNPPKITHNLKKKEKKKADPACLIPTV